MLAHGLNLLGIGPFSMAIDRDVGSGRFHDLSATKSCRAGLVWDGTGLQLITLEEVLS